MPKDKFTPLREKGFKSTDCDFDHISWDPKQIYNARALLLNLDKIDEFVNSIDPKILLLLQELKIASENQDFNISGFDKNGEATAGKAVSKNKSVPQSELGPVNQKNIAIKIAFKKIFEGLKEKNTTPQEINSEFAKEVDKELRDILIRLTFKRFNEEYEATYWKIVELFASMAIHTIFFTIVTIIASALFSTFLIFVHHKNKFFYDNSEFEYFDNASILLVFVFLSFITVQYEIKSLQEFSNESKDIINKIDKKELLKLMLPTTYWKKLALPIMILMSGQPLVKENKGK